MTNPLSMPVLVLTRSWQPHELQTVQHCLPMLYAGSCTALNVVDYVDLWNNYPVTWDEWIQLPIRTGMAWRPQRPDDDVLHSLHFQFRSPTIIILGKYDTIRKRMPKKNLRGVAARDNSTCQVTGKVIPPERWSIDHNHARSRGGTDDWENIALMDKDINHKKGSKSLEEAGLKLIRQPRAPLPMPPISFLYSSHPDHELFLHRKMQLT